MSGFSIENAHQCYRDVYSSDIQIPNANKVPQHIIFSILVEHSCDILKLNKELLELTTDLPKDLEFELKETLMLICYANLFLHEHHDDINYTPPKKYTQNIKRKLLSIFNGSKDISYYIIAIQLMFRMGMIDELIKITNTVPIIVNSSPVVKRILALIYFFQQDYKKSASLLKELINDPEQIKKPLVMLMISICMYKAGYDDGFIIDYSSLKNKYLKINNNHIKWILPVVKNDKPTFFIACDSAYFYQHAISAIYSIYEVNKDQANIHIHFYNPSLSAINKLNEIIEELGGGISSTFELIDYSHDNIKTWYASRRFIAAEYLLNIISNSVIIIDADCLICRSWSEWFKWTDKDIVVNSNDGRFPFWESVNAGFVYLGGGNESKKYARLVSNFIGDNLEKNNSVWFLDQIALSVAIEHSTITHSKIGRIDFNGDVNCLNGSKHAFSWAVTVNKYGTDTYRNYKDELAEKYGFKSFAFVTNLFSELSKTKRVNFVQIGAMNGKCYDPIHSFIKKYNWNGLLVEPLPDMMEDLRNNYKEQTGLQFANVAIADDEHEKKFYRILPNVIKINNLPDWLKGMSTFSLSRLEAYKEFVTETSVRCMTLDNLFKEYAIENIDFLQIDAEGYDFKVFKQFDIKKFRPALINIEVQTLPESEMMMMEKILLENNYEFYRYGQQDLIAIHHDFYFEGK